MTAREAVQVLAEEVLASRLMAVMRGTVRTMTDEDAYELAVALRTNLLGPLTVLRRNVR